MFPVKVLFLITELDIGGAEKALYEIVRGIDRKRFCVEVASLYGKGTVAEWLKKEEIPVHHLNMKGKWDAGVLFRLSSLLKNQNFDILYAFLFHAGLIGRFAALLAGTPAVISAVRVAEKRRPSHLILERLTRGLVTMYVAVSEDVRRFVIRECRLRPEKVVTIPNGVDFWKFEGQERKSARERLGLSPDSFVALFIGRLDEQKGPEYLIRAWAQALPNLAKAILLVAGEGPQREKLETLAHNLGISHSLRLVGFCDNVPLLFAASDIFILPSLWEGMPNVVLEAMAAGVPVIATSVEGSRELLLDGKAGVLVPPRDADSLAKAIVGIYNQPEKVRVLVRRAKKRVRENFTVERMVGANEALLERVAKMKDQAR